MPFDAHLQFARPDFKSLTDDILDGNVQRREPAAFRTVFTTEHRYDAGVAGFDGPRDPGEDGGFSVHFDGRSSIPSLIINGGSEVSIDGLAAMQAFADAVLDAVKMARRQAGVS